MNSKIYGKALRSLLPNGVGFTIVDTDYSTIEIFGENVIVPTEQDILTAYATVEVQYNLEQLRAERNRLLSETDWWASADLTMTAEQTAYRQALRDITNSYSSLDDVVWPEKP